MHSGFTYKNYGGAENMIASAGQYVAIIRVKNVASELGAGATITGAICSLYCYSEKDATVDAYRVFKPWVEGTQVAGDEEPGVTWDDWDMNVGEWTTPPCDCANDDGVDNSTDGGECDDASRRDRKATAESQVVVDATGWWGFTISTTLAQAWYDGTANENGLFLKAVSEEAWFRSTEYSSNQPHFTFTYTTEEPPEGIKLREQITGGGIAR